MVGLALGLYVLVGGLALPAHAQPACTHKLTGHAEDDLGPNPLADVHISVEPVDTSRPPRTAHTTAAGTFVVDGLCAGPHRVTAALHGFETREVQVELPSAHLDLVLAEDFEEIVVSTERLGREDTRAATTVDGTALEQTRGQDLAHALQSVPGVTVLGGSSSASQPMVRGLWGRRLLVLVDGVRLESQKWGADHGTEVDPFVADAVTVVRGAAGVRYGPDAIGGVVLVRPRPLRTTPGFDSEASAIGSSNGTHGTLALRLDGAHARVPGLAWRIEGNAQAGGAQRAPDYVLGNTGRSGWNLGAVLGYHAHRIDLSVSYRHHDTTTGVFFGLASATPDELAAALVRDRPLRADAWDAGFSVARPYQHVAHDTVSARATVDLGAVGSLEARYSFQHDRREEFDVVRASVEGPQFDFTLRTHHASASLSHAPIPVGGETKIEGVAGASASTQDNVYAGLPLVPNYTAWSGSAFVIERFWHRRFELELGARYDHQSRRTYLAETAWQRHVSEGALSSGACTVEGDVADCPQAWNAGSVSVGLLTRLWPDHVHLKLDLSSASRMPDADELFLSGTAPTLPVFARGRPDLQPETTWGASLTLDVDTRWVHVDASAYFNHVERYVALAPSLGPSGLPKVEVLSRGAFPAYDTTAGDARVYGFDGQVLLGPEWPVRLLVQTSLVRGERVGGGYLPFIPPDRVRASVTGHFPDAGVLSDSELGITTTYVADQDRWDAATDLAPPPDAYALLGLSAATRLRLGEQDLALGLVVDNLLNTPYRDATSLLRYFADAPGRDVRLRITATWDL